MTLLTTTLSACLFIASVAHIFRLLRGFLRARSAGFIDRWQSPYKVFSDSFINNDWYSTLILPLIPFALDSLPALKLIVDLFWLFSPDQASVASQHTAVLGYAGQVHVNLSQWVDRHHRRHDAAWYIACLQLCWWPERLKGRVELPPIPHLRRLFLPSSSSSRPAVVFVIYLSFWIAGRVGQLFCPDTNHSTDLPGRVLKWLRRRDPPEVMWISGTNWKLPQLSPLSPHLSWLDCALWRVCSTRVWAGMTILWCSR